MEGYAYKTVCTCACPMCTDIGRCATCKSPRKGKAKTVKNNHVYHSNLRIYLIYQEEVKSLTT